VPPRGTPEWIWERSSNPDSEGSANPEKEMEMDLNEDDTTASGGVEPNLNLGFGTVGPSSPLRAKSSVSYWGGLGLVSSILEEGSRTEVETPPSKLVSSPPRSYFREMSGSDSVGGGTRSVFQDHVPVPGSLRSPSRYPRGTSRFGPERTFPLHSHNNPPYGTVVVGVAGETNGMNVRTPDRRGVRDLRKLSGEEQCAQFRFSLAEVQSHIDEDEKENQHKLGPEAIAGANHSGNLFPGSPLSDSGIRSCSSTAGSLSPRAGTLSDSGSPAVHGDYDTACASRWGLRSDEIGMNVEGYGNDSDGGGSMSGYRSNQRRSAASADALGNGGEFDWVGSGGVSGRVEQPARVGACQDQDPLGSRSPFSCSTPGSCVDADVDPNSRGPRGVSRSTVSPRSFRSGLVSDRGSVSESRLRRRVKSRTMGDALSSGSRSYLRLRNQTPGSGSLEPFPPLFSSTLPEAIPSIHDARDPRNNINIELNTQPHTLRSVQAHEYTQEFDTLRFSSLSPSKSTSVSASLSPSALRNLLPEEDNLGEDKDSGAGPGLIGLLPLNTELRSYMKSDMKQNSNTRAGLNVGADGVLFNHDALGLLTSAFFHNPGDDDGRDLRHVDGIEHVDMGGLESKKLGRHDPEKRVSSVTGPVAGVSGVSADRSLFTPALGMRPHADGEENRSSSPGPWTTSDQLVDCRDGEEAGDCGLLRSLLESSDPWGLMRKTVLGLPSPTPSEIERRGKRQEEDWVRVRGSLGRRGVGYATPPSVDGFGGEVEMEVIEEGGGGESQEILDFRSSQPRTGHFSYFGRTCGIGVDLSNSFSFHSLPDVPFDVQAPSTFGLPSSDFTYSSTTIDTSSDPLGFPSPSTYARHYRDGDRHSPGFDYKLHSKASSLRSRLGSRRDEPRRPDQSTRERSRRSSDSEGSSSEGGAFADDGSVQVGERERLSLTLSPSNCGPGSSVFVSKREQPSLFFPCFLLVSV
jgi:hypothetical protein